jgi:hypothetical protein
VKRWQFDLTLDANGLGTVDTTRPVWGDVAEIRYNGTALVEAGTITITRKDDGGTIYSGTVAAEPWQYSPHQDMHNEAGAAVTYDGTNGVNAPIPVDGYVRCVVNAGTAGSANTGTVFLYVR